MHRRNRRRGRPPGMVLLEVLVAMTILAVGGAAIVSLASAFLDAVALWPRADLDRHLGVRAEGAWHLVVERPLPTLYQVTLTDSAHDHDILSTTLYRPDEAYATP